MFKILPTMSHKYNDELIKEFVERDEESKMQSIIILKKFKSIKT